MTTVNNIPHASTPRPQQLFPPNASSNLRNIQDTASTPNSLMSQTTSIHGNAGSDVKAFSLEDPHRFLTQYEAAQTEPWTARTSLVRQDQNPPFKKRAVSQTQSERPFTRNLIHSGHRLPGKSDSGYGTNGFHQTGLSNADYFSNHDSQCLSDERETNGDQNNDFYPETGKISRSRNQKPVSDHVNNTNGTGISWTSQYPSSMSHSANWPDEQLQYTRTKVKSGSPAVPRINVDS